MACGCNSNNNCYKKSVVRNYNNNTQAFIATTPTTLTIQGVDVVKNGVSVSVLPTTYTINKTGVYHISADVVFTPTADGAVTVSAYLDGVALPCTTKTVTGSANTAQAVHFETDLDFSRACPCSCDISRNITFAIFGATGVTGSVNALCTGVTKLA